jgi:hypothetical protein
MTGGGFQGNGQGTISTPEVLPAAMTRSPTQQVITPIVVKQADKGIDNRARQLSTPEAR